MSKLKEDNKRCRNLEYKYYKVKVNYSKIAINHTEKNISC